MFYKLILFLPEFFLCSLIILLTLMGLFPKVSGHEFSHIFPHWFKGLKYSLFVIMIAIILFLWSSYSLHGSDIFNLLISDKMTIIGKLLIFIQAFTWCGIGSNVIKRSFKRDGIRDFEYPILLITSLLGSFITISAYDFIMVYLGIELMIIPLYAVLALRYDNIVSKEVSIKYFIYNIITSGLILYGIALIYGYSSCTNFKEIYNFSYYETLIRTPEFWFQGGFLFVICGLLAKLGLVPFQSVFLDVCEGSTNTQMAFLVTTIQTTILLLIIRLFLQPFYSVIFLWKPFLLALSLASILWGSIGGLFQYNIRRLLAYGGLVSFGFIMMGLASGHLEGFQASLLALIIHTFTISGFIYFLSTLSQNDQNINTIDQLRGIAHQYPVIAFILTIFLFSLIGVPPFAGFWTKLYIVLATIDEGLIYLIVPILATVVGSFYYLRIIKVMYFSDPLEEELSCSFKFSLWLIVPFVLTTFFVFQSYLFDFAREILNVI